jgi:hypothetical protein
MNLPALFLRLHVLLGGSFVGAAPPMFESEKAQLTFADIERVPASVSHLFEFSSLRFPTCQIRACKTYPGDDGWPSDAAWSALNDITDGRLFRPQPQAAPCYGGAEYDAAKCEAMSSSWTDPATHYDDPLEMMSPVYQGLTCLPPSIYDSKNCTLGGFPLYVLNATTPKHVQAGINFARTTGVRLVIRNTGHDYSGKSGGAGSLSIWTHHMKDLVYVADYVDKSQSYSGPAFKAGAGVQAFEIYEAAHEKRRIVLGGDCAVSLPP